MGLDRVAARGAVELLTFLSTALPGASVRSEGALTTVLTAAPDAGVNVIVVVGKPADHHDALAREMSVMEGEGPVQVAFRCSGRVGRRFRSSLRGLGLQPLTEHRAMVHQPPTSLPPMPSTSLAITEVGNSDALDHHVTTMAAAFGMEIGAARRLFAPELVSESRVRFFNGSVDGQVVATASALRIGDVASINNIGVLDRCRHQGLGTAMTVAGMRWAHLAGSRQLVLDATSSGARLYRRLGFVEVDTVRFYQRL